MVCNGSSGIDYLLDFEFIKAVTCPYADAAGLTVVGLIVFGAIASSIYIRTGSMMLPFGLVMLTGGAVMGAVAGPAVAFATVLVLATGGGVMAYLYARFSR